MRYTLRQLEVFLAAARYENVSRAAESLAMSQSAASAALKELEQQFDVLLFDRIGKRLKLSELGRVLRPEAEALLARAADLQQSLAGEKMGGTLQIGATLTIGNYLAVQMIAAFRREYADTNIALSVANTRAIAEQVATFEIDLGMVEGELQHPDLEVSYWRDDVLQVFAAPGHPLAGASAVGDDALLDQAWILREPGSGTRQTFDRAMRGLLPDLTIAMELQHTEAIKRAVEAGLGIGCLSRICLEEAFRRGTLVPLDVRHRDFSRHFYLVTHRAKFHTAALSRWLELCRKSG